MMRLELAFAPDPGEVTHGYVSRLAQVYGTDAMTFCTSLGLSFRRIVDGDPHDLGIIAGLTGLDPEDLRSRALVRDGKIWRLGGFVLDRYAIRRQRLRVCPICVGSPSSTRVNSTRQIRSVQTRWLIQSVRICPAHRCHLVDLPEPSEISGLAVHDLAARILSMDLDALTRAPTSTGDGALRLTDFETYIDARIRGEPTRREWLDGLDGFVVARTCEMVGATTVWGNSHDLMAPDDPRWRAAAERGFQAAGCGKQAFCSLLAEIQAAGTHSGMERAQAVFGRLYKWINFAAQAPQFVPVRDVLREHILSTMPVAAGEIVLGVETRQRRLHSIRSASLEANLHPKRLRRMLADAGLIRPDHHVVPDNVVTFDAAAARGFLDSATQQLSLAEAEVYLNCPRVQTRLLVDAGILTPMVTEKGRGAGRYAFVRSNLDAFLDDLLRDAGDEPAGHDESLADLPQAAKRANCGVVEIVRLVRARKLTRLGRSHVTGGFLSLLVDVAEVRGAVRGPELDGLPVRDVAVRLRTTPKVVRALFEQDLLPARTEENPVNRCPVTVTSEESVANFAAHYESLNNIAQAWGLHFTAVNRILAERGVKPAFDRDLLKCTFYRRADVGEAPHDMQPS